MISSPLHDKVLYPFGFILPSIGLTSWVVLCCNIGFH